jgi:carboxyl-terminal processing protease
MELWDMKIRNILLAVLFGVGLSCNALTQGFKTLSSGTPLSNSNFFPTPAYIPASCQSQAIATLPAPTTIALPTQSLGTNRPITKSEQLKVFNELTTKITQIYLYPDFNGIDWPSTVAKYRAKIDGGLDTETFYKEMENLVAELNDMHSQFESPLVVAASEAELSGINNYVGIGVVVKPLASKGYITILAVFPDSPAWHAGLKPHDDLIAVDSIPLVENGIVYNQRMRGPECSAVRITVQSPGASSRDVSLIRDKISSSEPIDARLVPTIDGSRIGYIFIPTFFDETIPAQIKKALKDFGSLDGLILDNRMNPGGSSDVLEPVLSFFLSGTLGQFISRTANRPLKIKANPISNSQTVPMVILVGEDTYSFGEISSGIFQDQKRAKIVGQVTGGHVETLHGYNFDDGSRVWIAEERFDPANSHANWEHKGIQPDLVVNASWDTFTFETDPYIAAAIKLLGQK